MHTNTTPDQNRAVRRAQEISVTVNDLIDVITELDVKVKVNDLIDVITELDVKVNAWKEAARAAGCDTPEDLREFLAGIEST